MCSTLACKNNSYSLDDFKEYVHVDPEVILRTWLIASFVLSCIGSSAFAQSNQQPSEWGACDGPIRSYIGDRHSVVHRLRLHEDLSKGKTVSFEIGTPGDGKATIDHTWQIRLTPKDVVERAEMIVGIQRGGWVVFRDTSSSNTPSIEQFLFSPWDGNCITKGPVDKVKDTELPATVLDRFYELNRTGNPRSNRGQVSASIQDGTYIKAGDDFDTSTDRDEQVKAVIRSTPKAIYPAITALSNACLKDGAVNSTFDKKFLTPVDVDNDNDTDYILSDAHYYCIYRDTSLKSVGGENSANITLFSNTSNGIIQSFQLYTTSGEIYQYKGYAVYAGFGTGKTPQTKRFVEVKRGKSREIAALPAGGKLLYRTGGTQSRKTLLSALFNTDTEDDENGSDEHDDDVAVPIMRPATPVATPSAEVPSSYPTPVLVKLSEEHIKCSAAGGESLDIDDDAFATVVDYDGDGIEDIIADQNGLTCVYPDGKRVVSGKQNGVGTTYWLFSGGSDGVKFSHEIYAVNSKFRRHSGFASIEITDNNNVKTYQRIEGPALTPLVSVPADGEIVYANEG
jgi:hypothetical protein